jgi:hypothetical protein
MYNGSADGATPLPSLRMHGTVKLTQTTEP